MAVREIADLCSGIEDSHGGVCIENVKGMLSKSTQGTLVSKQGNLKKIPYGCSELVMATDGHRSQDGHSTNSHFSTSDMLDLEMHYFFQATGYATFCPEKMPFFFVWKLS